MNDKAFIDTTLFVYLYSEDEIAKKHIVSTAVKKHNCVISTQVLNEFSNVCIKKLQKTPEEIELALDEMISACNVYVVDSAAIKKSIVYSSTVSIQFL
jgi:predicted nucleic acid-binding protein